MSALLDGRRAIVTGGASGIGAATVAAISAAGARGCVLDLPGTGGGNVPDGWETIDVDMRSEVAVRDACAQAAATLGGLDAVVAAAGIVPAWSSVGSLDLDVWDDVFAVNARGVASTLKHASGHLGDGASIVVVASINAWRGDRNLSDYTASKHAVLGLVRSAALDLGRRGIRVNAVAPGAVATAAMLVRAERRAGEGGLDVASALEQAAAPTALGRIATVEDVAHAALFLLSNLAAATTGHLLPVDGGIG